MPALSKQEVERLIRQTAQEMGAGDLADVLVATAIAENGLSNTNPGDMGKDGRYHSFGPFHENDGGRGYGLTREQMEDVPAATRRAVAEFKAIQKKNPGVDMGTLAVLSQRPAEGVRAGYIKRVNDLVGGYASGGTPRVGGATTNGTTNGTASGGLPQGVLISRGGGQAALPQGYLLNGTSSTPGSVGGPAQAGGSAWPLPGGQVSNKFGGPQGRSPGMKGTLPSSNVGVDISGAKEGAPVVAPVSGEVVKVYQSQGVGNADENGGWGGMVLIKGKDGYFHRLSHLQQGSVGVKAGDQVEAGKPVAKVGATGNTMGGGKGPFVHLDWEKFQTKSGNPDDRNTMTFADPTTAGTAGNTSTKAGGTKVALQPAEIPQERVDKDPDVAERARRLQAQRDKVAGYDKTYNDAGRALQALREKYKGPDGQPLPRGPLTPADQLSVDVRLRPKGGAPKIPGWDRIPGYWEDNPDWIKDKAAWTANQSTYNDLDDRTEGKGKEWSEAEALAKTFESDYIKAQQDARERFAKESKEEAEKTPNPTYQIDSPSGTILKDGTPIGTVPREAGPGSVFHVPGVGTFRLTPEGKVEGPIEGTKPVTEHPPGTGQRVIDTIIEGKPVSILVGPDGKTIGTPWPREPKEGEKPSQITAPRDVKHIVRQHPDGKITVEDNPNYDPTTSDLTGASTTGRVYRVDKNGKATVTDVLTPEERDVYNRGKLADIDKTNIGNITGLLDSITKLGDAELKRQQEQMWNQVRKVITDPNSTPDQIIGAIQAGAKDADEWTKIFREHVNQKTQEEVGRANRVKESVDIQNADARAREGLYRDVNETRNQRTNAQRAANEAIAGSGIIGEANSMNVLSAMAPQVGSEGIRRAGTIGLGVGAGAIEPVQKSWEEHQAELQKLMSQMPAIRLANPDIKGPSFAMPKPTGVNINLPTSNGISDDLINLVKDRARGLTQPQAAPPDIGTVHPVPITEPPPAPTPIPEPEPAPPIPPPPPEEEEEDFSSTPGEGIGRGGGYKKANKVRFKAPQPRRKKVAA